MLPLLQQIEQEHGLPSPKLGGQWAKTSAAARKSWMITGLTAADQPAAYRAEKVFDTARSLGVEYVVICLGWWNDGLGHYAGPEEPFSPRRGVARSRWPTGPMRCGLKLGIHVMSASIGKNDAYVTPTPDPRLQKEGEDDAGRRTSTRRRRRFPRCEPPAKFGTATGYWAYGGTDVQIDNEIISYRGLRKEAPFALARLRPRAPMARMPRRTRPGPRSSTSPNATAGTSPIPSWPARSAATWPS